MPPAPEAIGRLDLPAELFAAILVAGLGKLELAFVSLVVAARYGPDRRPHCVIDHVTVGKSLSSGGDPNGGRKAIARLRRKQIFVAVDGVADAYSLNEKWESWMTEHKEAQLIDAPTAAFVRSRPGLPDRTNSDPSSSKVIVPTNSDPDRDSGSKFGIQVRDPDPSSSNELVVSARVVAPSAPALPFIDERGDFLVETQADLDLRDMLIAATQARLGHVEWGVVSYIVTECRGWVKQNYPAAIVAEAVKKMAKTGAVENAMSAATYIEKVLRGHARDRREKSLPTLVEDPKAVAVVAPLVPPRDRKAQKHDQFRDNLRGFFEEEGGDDAA